MPHELKCAFRVVMSGVESECRAVSHEPHPNDKWTTSERSSLLRALLAGHRLPKAPRSMPQRHAQLEHAAAVVTREPRIGIFYCVMQPAPVHVHSVAPLQMRRHCPPQPVILQVVLLAQVSWQSAALVQSSVHDPPLHVELQSTSSLQVSAHDAAPLHVWLQPGLDSFSHVDAQFDPAPHVVFVPSENVSLHVSPAAHVHAWVGSPPPASWPEQLKLPPEEEEPLPVELENFDPGTLTEFARRPEIRA